MQFAQPHEVDGMPVGAILPAAMPPRTHGLRRSTHEAPYRFPVAWRFRSVLIDWRPCGGPWHTGFLPDSSGSG
jgi:hypothetical protein